MHLTVAIISALVAGVLSAGGDSYSYVRDNAKGPAMWADINADCGKTRQSPIDLVGGTEMQRVDWTLGGWSNAAARWTAQNVGSTVKLTLSDETLTTTGGGLPASYDVVQLHFHWGQITTKGSEHTVKGSSYPLEMHIVHKKAGTDDLGAALGTEEGDALAVLGYFFEIADTDNAAIATLIEAVTAVQTNTSESAPYDIGTLSDLVGEVNDGDWWRYLGSLTTPDCQEQVVWTVFSTPIPISDTQMDKFRGVTSSYGAELYRPVQPLGSRTITRYTDVSAAPHLILSASLAFTAVAQWLLL